MNMIEIIRCQLQKRIVFGDKFLPCHVGRRCCRRRRRTVLICWRVMMMVMIMRLFRFDQWREIIHVLGQRMIVKNICRGFLHGCWCCCCCCCWIIAGLGWGDGVHFFPVGEGSAMIVRLFWAKTERNCGDIRTIAGAIAGRQAIRVRRWIRRTRRISVG